MIHDFAGDGAVRKGVVGDAAGDDGALGEVADVLPAEGDAGLDHRGLCLLAVVSRPGSPEGCVPGVRVGDAEAVARVALDGLAGEADAGEALRGGEDDAAVGIVPSVGFVLTHDGELDAVDGEELVEGQAEGHGGKDVDLDEGLASGVVGAESVLPSPFEGEGGEVVRQAEVLLGPGIGTECVDSARGFSNSGNTVGRGSVLAGWSVRGDAALRFTSGRPVGSRKGIGTGGRFARGGCASGTMSRRLVGDDDGVSRPIWAGDGGVSGIIRDLLRGGTGVSGHGSASGMIRGGRRRRFAVADLGPQVGVVAGQAAKA